MTTNASLEPESASELIEVSGEAPIIETSRNEMGGTVSPTEVTSHPRSQLYGMMTLVPGVRPAEGFDPTKTRVGNISINAGDGRQLDISVDGGDNKKIYWLAAWSRTFRRSHSTNFCNSYEEEVTDTQFNQPRAFCQGPSNGVNGGVSGSSAFAIPFCTRSWDCALSSERWFLFRPGGRFERPPDFRGEVQHCCPICRFAGAWEPSETDIDSCVGLT